MDDTEAASRPDTERDAAEEFLTVAAAARRLGVSEPRLRRLLRLSEWADARQEREYRTRTGTRTGLVVRVPVLDALAAALSGEAAGGEQERERRHRAAPMAGQEKALAVALLAEKDERIADLKAQIDTKDRQIEALTLALKLAQENIAREQVLEAMPSGGAIGPKETETEAEEKAAEPAKQRRPWWRIWGQG